VIEKALEKDPADRYQSMREMVVDLRRLVRQSVEAPAAVLKPLPAHRHKWIAPAAIATLLVMLAAVIWLRPRPPARVEYTQLTNFSDSATSPALSPDGKMLTFIRGASSFTGRGQIYVKILPDGEPKPLTQTGVQIMSPLFSPDGSRIAYTTVDDHNEWDTWEVPVLGGQPRRWLPNASGLIWFGKQKLLFSEKIRNSKGNHMKIVVAAESRADAKDVYVPMPRGAMAHRSYASPDGKWVLVAEMDDRGFWLPCRVVPMDGSSAGHSVGPPSAPCWFAAWSPDGKWMYLNSSANGGFHIWRQHFDGGRPDSEPEQITSGPMEEEGLAMDPDGRSFITGVGLRHSSVWLRDTKGERQISLEGYARQAKLTPDGKKLLYVVGASALPERAELWLADLDSGRNEPLLPGFSLSTGGSRGVFDISPDGQQVVLEVTGKDRKARLWLAYLDRRSPPQQIPNAEGDGPMFSPDGDIIFRGRDGDYGVAYRVHTDGTGLHKAYDYPITGISGLSPDGRWLVVYARPSEHEAGASLALPLAGGSPVKLFGSGITAKWSRNGGHLFLSIGSSQYSGYTGNTYVLPLPRGKMLPEIPPGGYPTGDAIRKLPGVGVIDTPDVDPGPTPDVYAFSRGKVQRNLYRVPVP
jgi:Tol biopolymer transport system component